MATDVTLSTGETVKVLPVTNRQFSALLTLAPKFKETFGGEFRSMPMIELLQKAPPLFYSALAIMMGKTEQEIEDMPTVDSLKLAAAYVEAADIPQIGDLIKNSLGVLGLTLRTADGSGPIGSKKSSEKSPEPGTGAETASLTSP